ncbi:unnamed protein product, partial [Amoebophrya sp. A25]
YIRATIGESGRNESRTASLRGQCGCSLFATAHRVASGFQVSYGKRNFSHTTCNDSRDARL